MTSLPPARVHAIVPMKELARAKSRLAGHLAPAEQRTLALAMLRRVVETLCAAGEPGPQPNSQPTAHLAVVQVISRDSLVLQAAAAWGAQPLAEAAPPPGVADGLNSALHQAQATAEQAGASALLVVPADVPLLTLADVAGLLAALQSVPPGRDTQGICVLAPNADQSGTNALGLTLPARLPFQFGHGSFARHRAAARALGLHVAVYTSPTLALDIDTPADLAQARQVASPLTEFYQERSYCDGNYWLCCGP